jgi:hypothetical protein
MRRRLCRTTLMYNLPLVLKVAKALAAGDGLRLTDPW